MRLIHSLDSLAAFNRPCVATVGAFDALHIGHQTIIRKTQALAKDYQLPAVVVMFEPLPGEFFAGKDIPPKRIYTLRRRIELVRDLGVDYLVCLSFTKTLANWTADEFIQGIILDRLRAHHLVVGDDFRFGKNREGDYNMLCDYGNRFGFGVDRIEAVTVGDVRVSSTRIRELLLAGELAQANRLLGNPYCVTGRVRQGDRLGSQLGCPTANLAFGRRQPPLHGVFAVSLKVQGVELKGVSNAGVRPTVDGKQYRIETHIFDFSKDLYGECMTIYPLHYIRAEQRYADIEQLKNAICKDINAAQSFLEREKNDRTIDTGNTSRTDTAQMDNKI